jgi:beta-xylosidase
LARHTSESTPDPLRRKPQRASDTRLAAKPLRYCNSLAIDSYPSSTNVGKSGTDMIALADPTIIRYQDTYYLVASGGLLWVSDDLVNWTYREVTLPKGRQTAPAIIASRNSG